MVTTGRFHSLGRRGRREDVATQVSQARRPDTKELLMATGERLFGQFGINAVSLREIGVAAGQTNSGVVQYHFADKRGLLIAIIKDRFRRFEGMWCERIARLGPDSTQDPRELLRTLWGPMTSIRDTDGNHPFCRFLLQYVLQPQGPEHPSLDVVAYRRSRMAPADLPCLGKVRRLLRRCYPQLPAPVYGARLSTVGVMFLSSVVEHDNARMLLREQVSPEFDLDFVLDLAVAAIGASLRK